MRRHIRRKPFKPRIRDSLRIHRRRRRLITGKSLLIHRLKRNAAVRPQSQSKSQSLAQSKLNICHIEVKGGLGNQMFMIAAAYAHAKDGQLRLSIGATQTNARPFYFDSFLRNCKRYVAGPLPNIPKRFKWEEPHFHYAKIPNVSRYLSGYFQSSKYFKGYENEIRALFEPPPEIKDAVQQKYGEFVGQRERFTAVHIRRGDYFTGNNKEFHGTLDSAYFNDAMSTLTGSNFLVFSDDIAWCKQNLTATDVQFIDEADECLTLWLMIQFPQIIISNSTFSWWAAFLGDQPKTVIAPVGWFGPKGPQDWHDIYESGWQVR